MPSTNRDQRLPPGTRRILHLDVDAFLASVEQALHPELRGKPVVVGGPPTARNLVMACSYEARRFGVRSGMLLAEAARRCPTAAFRDGDSQAAGRLREAIARLCLEYTPTVDITSIDDLLLDLTGTRELWGSAFECGAHLRTEVQRRLHLPVTIGIGTNPMLARIAGKLGKPGGVAEILPGHEEELLAHLPVRQLPGVGHSIGGKLDRFAIRTVGDLRQASRELLFASFGHHGLALYESARGRDPSPVEAGCELNSEQELVLRPPRSIRRISTFEPEEGRRELIEAMLAYLVERATHRLRHFGLALRCVEVSVQHVDTRPSASPEGSHSDPRGRGSMGSGTGRRRYRFATPTDSTAEIWREALELLRQLPRKRALVKRIGLSYFDLLHSSGWQGRLFSDDDRWRRIDSSVDDLRARLGFGRIMRGTSYALIQTHPLGPDGFRLRTPSLNQ